MKENFKELPIEKWVQYVITLFTVIVFGSIIIMLCKVPVPEGNKDTLNLVLGALTTIVIMIFGFFYGSSKGGRENRDQLNQLTDKLIDKTKDNNNP